MGFLPIVCKIIIIGSRAEIRHTLVYQAFDRTRWGQRSECVSVETRVLRLVSVVSVTERVE